MSCLKALSILGLLGTYLLAAPSDTQASAIMGNLPGGESGYFIGDEAANTEGVAVEFTPLQNVTFDSVTLWVSGYTGLGAMGGVEGANLSLSLMEGSSPDFGCPREPSQPMVILASALVAPNDGSDAAFTFDLSGSLQANRPYYLFAYLYLTGDGNPFDFYSCTWDSGGAPTGDIVVNGSRPFLNGSFGTEQSGGPAFALNRSSAESGSLVPEPSTAAFSALLLISLGMCAFRKLRKV